MDPARVNVVPTKHTESPPNQNSHKIAVPLDIEILLNRASQTLFDFPSKSRTVPIWTVSHQFAANILNEQDLLRDPSYKEATQQMLFEGVVKFMRDERFTDLQGLISNLKAAPEFGRFFLEVLTSDQMREKGAIFLLGQLASGEFRADVQDIVSSMYREPSEPNIFKLAPSAADAIVSGMACLCGVSKYKQLLEVLRAWEKALQSHNLDKVVDAVAQRLTKDLTKPADPALLEAAKLLNVSESERMLELCSAKIQEWTGQKPSSLAQIQSFASQFESLPARIISSAEGPVIQAALVDLILKAGKSMAYYFSEQGTYYSIQGVSQTEKNSGLTADRRLVKAVVDAFDLAAIIRSNPDFQRDPALDKFRIAPPADGSKMSYLWVLGL